MRLVCAAGLAAAMAAMAGCGKKDDPRERPGFVDTSDPAKVGGTMSAPPGLKTPKDKGKAGKPGGMPPSGGKPDTGKPDSGK